MQNFMVVDVTEGDKILIAGLSQEEAVLSCQELIVTFPYRSFIVEVDRRA